MSRTFVIDLTSKAQAEAKGEDANQSPFPEPSLDMD